VGPDGCTAAGAHKPSAAQQFAALAGQTAVCLLRGHTREAVAAAVRGRCRALRQKVRFQASILPVSEAALSLTRSFQVPFATSEEAFTV